MKIKDEVNRLKKLAMRELELTKDEFKKICSEYCYLYKTINHQLYNPSMKLISKWGVSKVYVDRKEYIDVLEDLAYLRYAFSRMKFKGYKKNVKSA